MDRKILLAHGSGGKLSAELIDEVFLPVFKSPLLAPLSDQAVFEVPAAPAQGSGKATSRLAMTTDSFVVDPLFFPGGDIGKLAVCGTINDLAVGGARPLYLSAGFIIEEGLDIGELERVAESMAECAAHVGVEIITGDTKVVERGKGDKLFINTTGVGVVGDDVTLGPRSIEPGDAVIVSGHVGDHGMAILTHREGVAMEVPVKSDCAPLDRLALKMLDTGGVRAMRDATRGGLATVLCEISELSGHDTKVFEERVPMAEPVRGACEMLGFDPLYLANEGKLVAFVDPEKADEVLTVMKADPDGMDAAIIGEVTEATRARGGRLLLETVVGNVRVLERLTGEQLPRIC